MKKVYFLLPIICLAILTFASCKSDDNGGEVIPPNDRGDQAIADQIIIEKYLETHFYNYEDFAAPAADFDFKILLDTIAGENADKIPLIDQVSSKTVKDRFDEDVTYTLYYLTAVQGGGKSVAFPDICTVNYVGSAISEKTVSSDQDENNDGVVDENDTKKVYPFTLFDSAVTPIRFDLTNLVNGFQDTMIEFNAASVGPVDLDGDGNVEFEDFGVGAMFIPSGLGYFSAPPSGTGIGPYNQLVFTFNLFQAEVGDQDADTVYSVLEDINGNGLEEDDDTDDDGFPNFVDPDDDGDGTLTIDEIFTQEYVIVVGEDEPVLASNEYVISAVESINDDGVSIITITTITLTDTDNDGTPDYLDTDNS